ncbi:MAG: PH domain-containing protein [Oscillospiraceae bacterium]
MKFERISVKAVILWEILATLVFALILALILFVFLPHTWLWYTLLWLLGAVFVLTAFLYIPIAYLNIEYAINSRVIIYRKGVLFPNTEVLYRDRIAFVTIYNNPLTPILKINSLVISAAGGDMRILFMNSKRAKEIADLLSKN